MATDFIPTASPNDTLTANHEILDVQTIDCCIVGGGPAGAVLALLLARQGIAVMLLEAHKDFEREFRGDTIHPSVMEIMEELGLADRLLQLHHSKLRQVNIQTQEETFTLADFSHLKTKYPYITVLPQARFLEFITGEAKHYPNFQLILGANVQELIEEGGEIRGVRYRGHGGWHEVRALLTVGADGRHSRLRQLAGFKPIETSPPMDVLWFRLPRSADEAEGLNGRIGRGHIIAMVDRSDYWQIGFVIPKGGYQQLRTAGMETLRQSLVEVVGELRDRVELLKDWSQVAFLCVESSRLPQWYRAGLLLIGDAAHVMSPVGGVGINYAIGDAVAVANVLSEKLKTGKLQPRDLAKVQRRRELPIRFIQAFQSFIQEQIFVRALNTQQRFQPPAFLRVPILRDLPARLIAFGLWSPHVNKAIRN